jgi:hypothetical protein
MEDKVNTKYCDTQHRTLDSRMDRIDSMLFWILTFMILSAVGLLSNIGLKMITSTLASPVSATTTQSR